MILRREGFMKFNRASQCVFPLSCILLISNVLCLLRFCGVVTGVGDVDSYRWPNSKWRCLMVHSNSSSGALCIKWILIYQMLPWGSPLRRVVCTWSLVLIFSVGSCFLFVDLSSPSFRLIVGRLRSWNIWLSPRRKSTQLGNLLSS